MKKLIIAAMAIVGMAAMESCCNDKNCGENKCMNAQAEEVSAIRLNVFYTVSDEANRAKAIEIAKELVAASRLDAGCISYDFLESATQPGEYMIIETWENDSVLDLHSNATHFATYVPQLHELGEMRLERFEIKK